MAHETLSNSSGHLPVVELLLDRAAVNQAVADKGITPGCLTVPQGHLSMAELLLDRGAAVNQAATDNGTEAPPSLGGVAAGTEHLQLSDSAVVLTREPH